MESYWDCSLCRIENKGQAFRCRSCCGRLKGRDRLLREALLVPKTRRVAGVLSAFAAGLGQLYSRRWATGVVFGLLLPLTVGLVTSVWQGFTYGHLFLAGAAVYVLLVAVVDARHGPAERRAPCQQTCPAGVDIPDYLQLTVNGDYEQAYSLVRSKVPLVGVIGRVCPHPCEARCVRGIDGEPISVNGCKRFLADRHRERVLRASTDEGRRPVVLDGARVSLGVVGSGPAGLACAYYLSVLGASVTVYEADRILGGRLASTIPDYRLPPYILEEEIEELRDRGVIFRLEAPVGPGGTSVDELLDKHRGLFLGVGAQESLRLAVPGSDRFHDFQTVLRAAKMGAPLPLGRRVAVVGGGNAAMDVCRTLLRSGSEEVHLVYRRSREEMPARADEVEEAIREGVTLHLLTDPVEGRLSVPGEGGGLLVRRMVLGAPDPSGRPRPEPVAGSEWLLEVDGVVPALGQAVRGGVFEDPALQALRREPDGRICADPSTQRTSSARLYAGGDAVSGPATAVRAMAQGRRAALAMWAELSGTSASGLPLVGRLLRQRLHSRRETPEARIREEMPKLSLRSRLAGFREVDEGLREGSACREAGRCIQCHRDLP